MATIVERRPGVFFARVFVPPTADAAGRQVGRTFRGTKKAVRTEVAAWEAEVLGRAPKSVGATVGDLLERWMAAKEHQWQPTTLRDYRGRVASIRADLGNVRLVDLDPLRVDDWLAGLRKRGLGPGALRGRVTVLKSACSWGVSRRMLSSNPVVDAAPRARSGRRTVRPEPEQVVALLAAAEQESERAGLAMRLAAVTGAREAELVALAWNDLSGEVLRIRRQRHGFNGETIIRDRTKTGEGRNVIIDGGTAAAIHAWRAEVDELVGAPTKWMLAEPGAEIPPSPRWIYDVFVRAAKKAGVPTGRKGGMVLHDLRHWTASTALRDGHDPVTVAARLGHSPDTLLRIYAQEIEQGQVGVAASLAARLDQT